MQRTARKPLLLNAGCGGDPRGDVRLDFNVTGKPHLQGMVEALPFRDGAFTHVMAMNVLEHTPNPGLALREFHRVLAPGGEVRLQTDNAACLWYHLRPPLRFVEGHEYHGDPGDHHYMLFKAHHLRDMARQAGFSAAEAHYVENDTTRGLARLLHWLRPELAAQHVVLEARK